jgi:hypothetical protein
MSPFTTTGVEGLMAPGRIGDKETRSRVLTNVYSEARGGFPALQGCKLIKEALQNVQVESLRDM